jgi:hypothetical protein
MTQDNPATAPEAITTTTAPAATDTQPAAVITEQPATIASGAAPEPKVTAPADFPEDWRNKFAAGDEKELKRLERFGSPTEVFKAYREIEKKLSSGTVKQALPANPTAEQLAEWRKDNGIPETPDGYDATLQDIVIGESDKPLVNEFLKEMHAQNASPTAVKGALAAYYKIVEQQALDTQIADEDFKAAALGELQAEWGADFRKNVNMVGNLLATAPEDVKARIETARTADGRVVGNDPAIMKWLNQLAREVNPAAAIVPNAGSNAMKAMSEEKAALEAKMGTAAYGQAERSRYIEIVEAEQKINGRAA